MSDASSTVPDPTVAVPSVRSDHALITAEEIILGFTAAALISVPLGFIIVPFKPLERAERIHDAFKRLGVIKY